MDVNNQRKKYLKSDQNTGSENIFTLLDGMKSDLEDEIDELMNYSDTEFVFEKENSGKADVSDDQPKNILISGANIHVIEDRGENPEDSEWESQEDRVDVPEAKDKPKWQSNKKEKGKGKEKVKKVEVPLNWRKKISPQPKRQCNLSAKVAHSFHDNHSPFDVFFVVMNLDLLLKLLVDPNNLSAHQNGREFKANIDEKKKCLGINYFIT